jgi:uncharacterized membrane protein
MNAPAAAAIRSNSRALLIIFSALALLALWFIAKRALPYFEFSPTHYGPYFWPRRWWLVLHVAGGVIALTAGLVQLWLGLTNRVAAVHRSLGKVYLGAIIMGSLAGFYLSLTIPGNAPYAAGLFSLCVAWVVTTTTAVLAIRRRNLLQHREWMMRSYAVTFAFVTFRVGVDALVGWQGLSPGDAQAIMAWACWAIPLLLLEPSIQLRKAPGVR